MSNAEKNRAISDMLIGAKMPMPFVTRPLSFQRTFPGNFISMNGENYVGISIISTDLNEREEAKIRMKDNCIFLQTIFAKVHFFQFHSSAFPGHRACPGSAFSARCGPGQETPLRKLVIWTDEK